MNQVDREDEFKRNIGEAIEAFDNGLLKVAFGKLLWAVCWLTDEIYLIPMPCYCPNCNANLFWVRINNEDGTYRAVCKVCRYKWKRTDAKIVREP